MQKNNKKFSVKKLLLTILCTVTICTFIGSTYLFISVIPAWMEWETFSIVEDSNIIREMGQEYEERMKESIKYEKQRYGEEYPAEGILTRELILYFSANSIVNTYLMSLLMGILLGTMLYIIVIQSAKGKKLIIELIIAIAIIFMLLIFFHCGYKVLINRIINRYFSKDITYIPYEYYSDSNVIMSIIITTIVIYLGNLIYQKIQTYRLNKELGNKL